jgi:tetrahydromethanopterin S-methyltransferase subunit F
MSLDDERAESRRYVESLKDRPEIAAREAELRARIAEHGTLDPADEI